MILLIWCAGLGAAAQYGKISVIYDLLPDLWPGQGASLAFIVSLVGFVGIVFGIVAGLLVARIGYRRALIGALWAGAALSLVQAALPPLWFMLALRAVEGASHLAIVVAAPTLIAQLSAPQHRGLTLSLWSTFFGVAYTILVIGGLPLVAALGAQALFVAHALWMAALALILGRSLRRLGAPAPQGALTLAGMLRDHRVIYASPFLSAPAVIWLVYTFCFLAILTLIPPAIPEPARAATLAAMPLVSIIVSMTLGVAALRRFRAVDVVTAGFIATILCLLWLVVQPGLPVACLALAAAFGLIQGATFAAVPQLTDDAAGQAQANGAMAQMGNLGNTLGTPVLAGVLALGGFPVTMAVAAAILALGLALHVWLAARRRS